MVSNPEPRLGRCDTEEGGVTLRSNVYMGLPQALAYHLWVSDTTRYLMVLIGMVGCDTNSDTTPAAILEYLFESTGRGFWDRPSVGSPILQKCQPDEWLQAATEPILSLRPVGTW
jgi:hypothetical protein